MQSQYEINKEYTDEFGRVSGIFPIDKPIGKTSHDMVYEYRRKFETRKVSHAGALDPFASGLLIILVGKALKSQDSFLELDKEYEADVLLGVSTDTEDTEGRITNAECRMLNEIDALSKVLKSFQPEYLQDVPVFSSVKVQGQKLRELARKYERFEIISNDDKKVIQFYKDNEVVKEVNLPSKVVKIYEITLLGVTSFGEYFKENNNVYLQKFKENLLQSSSFQLQDFEKLQVAKIRVKCSKGTYIRQLAVDIGEKLGLSAMLVGLRRAKVGDIVI